MEKLLNQDIQTKNRRQEGTKSVEDTGEKILCPSSLVPCLTIYTGETIRQANEVKK